MDGSSGTAGRSYHPVVEISNGFKHFGIFNNWKTVLQKLNLKAYFGELYVLLGPHGCGKTTVLNVILGLTKLTQGSVEVCGFKPGTKGSGIPGMRIGYTPQSLGLYEEFTVSEVLKYYGRLLGLPGAHITERISFLNLLLSLPPGATYIHLCPETVKRQISFAIALLHEPELLILDEPTAGVDPILHKSIWEHLREISGKEETTVIVTTQQASEAAKSQRLGIMRNGMIIEEGEPQFLLKKYKSKDIENVYMKIYMIDVFALKCHQQTVISNTPAEVCGGSSEGFFYERRSVDQRAVFQSSDTCKSLQLCCGRFYSCLYYLSCRNLRSLLYKDSLLFIRHYILAFFFVAVPLVLIAVFGVFIGGKPHQIPICVINEDRLVDRKNMPSYSDLFLEIMQQHNMVIHYHRHIKTAVRDVKYKRCFALVVIGRFYSDIFKFPNETEDMNESCPTAFYETNTHCVTSHLDESSNFMASYISRTLITVRNKVFQQASRKSKRKHFAIYQEGNPAHGVKETPMSRFLLPGFAAATMSHTSAFLTAYHLLYLRNNNLLLRDYIAGVTFIEMSVSHFVIDSILLVIIVFLIVPLFIVFECYASRDIIPMVAIVYSQLAMGLCFGCALGAFSKNGSTLSLVNIILFLLNLLMGGVVTPTWTLDWCMRTIVLYVNPTSLAVENIRTLASGKSLEAGRFVYSLIYPHLWAAVCIIIFSIGLVTKKGVLRPAR